MEEFLSGEFKAEITDDGAVITEYLGNNSIVNIPREILGNKTIEIGDEVFRNMDFIAEVIFPEGLKAVGNYAFCGCRGLTSVKFPQSLEEIGSHAFYNCRNIKEMSIMGNISYIGDGFIKNCDSIQKININSADKISPAAVSFLNELKDEFLLTAADAGVSLVFPQYDYDFFVNAPARICTTVTVGAGARYRQALSSKGINFLEYDEAFDKAVVEEREGTVFRIIFERLAAPYKLDDRNHEKYVAYAKNNIEYAIRFCGENGNIKYAELMQESGIITSDNIDKAVETAAEIGSSELSAFLLDLKLSVFKSKAKNFDL